MHKYALTERNKVSQQQIGTNMLEQITFKKALKQPENRENNT